MQWKRWQADFLSLADRVVDPVADRSVLLWERRWLRQAVWAVALFTLCWLLSRSASGPVAGVQRWVSRLVLTDFDPFAPGRSPDSFWRTASLDELLADAKATASRLPWSKPPAASPGNATLVQHWPDGAAPGGNAPPTASPVAPPVAPSGVSPAPSAPDDGATEPPDNGVPPPLTTFAHFPLLAAQPQIVREWGWQSPGHDLPPLLHEGIDLAAQTGDTVVAVAEGTVSATGETQTDGVWLELDHGGGLTTYYAQLGQLLVRVGDRVGSGQAVGHVGESREPGMTVAHVHFEVRKDGKAVEPGPFLPQANGTR